MSKCLQCEKEISGEPFVRCGKVYCDFDCRLNWSKAHKPEIMEYLRTRKPPEVKSYDEMANDLEEGLQLLNHSQDDECTRLIWQRAEWLLGEVKINAVIEYLRRPRR